MRVQHNITAMNAYRNYNNNTKAVSKNLEKLSSGYKINRAGDDAAGLAISEKMRAQITGLATAQKNAKDGISLIQTAEGALTEVHSMLNRMFELAEQSANGTYDNAVDRANLQKEFDALRDEIDRIADSSNFNGQKLLDGSLVNGTVSGASSNVAIGDLGAILGTDTITAKDAVVATPGEFSIDLGDMTAYGEAGDSFDITVGNNTYTIAFGGGAGELAVGTTHDATAIAAALATAITAAGVEANDGTTIAGGDFAISSAGSVVTVVQNAAPTTASDTFDSKMNVSVDTSGITSATASLSAGDFTGLTAPKGTTNTNLEIDFENLDAAKIAAAAQAAGATSGDAIGVTYDHASKTYSLMAGSTVLGTAVAAAAGTATTETLNFGDLGTIDLTATNDFATDVTADEAALVSSTITFNAAAADSGVKYTTFNRGTTDNIQGTVAVDGSRASTKFELTEDMLKDGASIKIGNETYVFKVGADSTTAADAAKGEVLVDLSELTTSGNQFVLDAAQKLTDAAVNNAVFSVGIGHNGTRITLSETDANATAGANRVDLTSKDKIQEQVTFKAADRTGTGLTLQIGDTADSYNMLTVSVSDMHCSALGIDKGTININAQGLSQQAMDAIKTAINSVSSTRGDLGALQNRLDHTINNLGVMEENIQDAESTIRDTDVAKEMMAYTKNNILVQSAQAMLAQANQLPQGVLQLLG